MTHPTPANAVRSAPTRRIGAARRKRIGRRLRRAEADHAKLLKRMTRAIEASDLRRARGLQRLNLSAYSAKLTAAAYANRKLKGPKRIPASELVDVAARIDTWREPDERATANAIDKAGPRSFRTVVNFGIERRALQTLVRSAIKPFLVVDPRQHGSGNGGRDEACRRIRQALDDGYKWFVGLDITRFYPSIDRRRLPDIIPAPSNVILAVTSLSDDRVDIGRIGKAITSSNLIHDALEGVSQGSLLSPMLAEAVIANMMAEVQSDLPIVNFADDFGVMARSKREAEMVAMDLINAARRSPQGLFQLRKKVRPVHVADGFEFLGYHFKRSGPHITCRPTEKHEVKFFTHALKLIRRLQRHRPGATEKLRRYVQGWSQAFSLWKQGDELFWPRFWVRGVAREHALRALPAVELAMEWEGHGFKPIPASQPPRAVAEPAPLDVENSAAETTPAETSAMREHEAFIAPLSGIWSRSRPAVPTQPRMTGVQRIVATPVVPWRPSIQQVA